MPSREANMGYGTLNGQLFVVGGADASGNTLHTLLFYNFSTNSWTARAPMPTARFDLFARSLNGQIFAVGGVNENGTTVAANEAYTP
jgi:N-acetylneuraminic acid mutarotase